jgi:hypothetical protein
MTTAHNNRAFMAQETLDVWLADELVSLDGEVLTLLPEVRGRHAPAFLLTTAVYFQAEVTTGEDPLGLCGQVKTLAKVLELGGEHAPGSVVVGDNAYEVRDGFVGDLLPEHAGPAGMRRNTDPNAGRAALAALSTLASAVER